MTAHTGNAPVPHDGFCEKICETDDPGLPKCVLIWYYMLV